MNYRIEHVAIYCKDIRASAESYEKLFGGTSTEIRTGAAGYPFCFIKINGERAIQLCESKDQTGVHHYGFVADDLDQAEKEFKAKGTKVLRENRDSNGKLTAVFLQDPTGLEVEIRQRE
jgi:predicted enzyme related to lactoylglutathione lyase